MSEDREGKGKGKQQISLRNTEASYKSAAKQILIHRGQLGHATNRKHHRSEHAGGPSTAKQNRARRERFRKDTFTPACAEGRGGGTRGRQHSSKATQACRRSCHSSNSTLQEDLGHQTVASRVDTIARHPPTQEREPTPVPELVTEQ